MERVSFPLPLISKNGAFQNSKQFWVDFTGKLTLSNQVVLLWYFRL